jgi:hypothetical protein
MQPETITLSSDAASLTSWFKIKAANCSSDSGPLIAELADRQRMQQCFNAEK